MSMKKVITLILALALLTMLFAACGSSGSASSTGSSSASASSSSTSSTAATSTETKTEVTSSDNLTAATVTLGDAEAENVIADEITIAFSTDIIVDPWNSWNEGRQYMMPLLYQTLAEFNSDSENGMMGILMKNFTDLGDNTYEIEIYDYIYDSAGNHLTADDVVFSFNGFKNAGKSVKCKLIESVEATGDYTVQVKLNTSSVGEIEGLLCNQVFIVTQAAYEASPDGMATQPIATGPYKVTDFVSGSSITFEKRDDYWQTDESLTPPGQAANAEKITYIIIRESSQMSINLETGAIDAAQVSSYEVSRFEEGGESSEGFTAIAASAPKFQFLFFNMSADGGLFADNLEARQAICYALDQQGILDGAFDGYGVPVYSFGCPTAIDFDEAWNTPYYTYDPDKAMELIKSSGLDQVGTIRIVATNNERFKTLAQTIQSYLIAVGLDAEVDLLESALFSSTITDPSAWDIGIMEKSCTSYYSELANVWNNVTPSLSLAVDDTLDDLVNKSRDVSTHDEYVGQYVEYMRENAINFPLFSLYNNFVVRDGISTVYLSFKGYLMPNAFTFTADFNN